MTKVKLDLTHDDLNTLTLAADAKRGQLTKVPKEALKAILIDYSRLIKYIGRDNLEGVL